MPSRGRERAPLPRSARELVGRFASAVERGDMDSVVSLLTDDAWLTMPPQPYEYQGGQAIARLILHEREAGAAQTSLAELFDGRSQLLVYHFMFGPSYEAGCPTCSSMADTVYGAIPHLHAHDVTMMYVSQSPLEKLQA
jgi:hypothetical protein